jgi:hypothetical protein
MRKDLFCRLVIQLKEWRFKDQQVQSNHLDRLNSTVNDSLLLSSRLIWKTSWILPYTIQKTKKCRVKLKHLKRLWLETPHHLIETNHLQFAIFKLTIVAAIKFWEKLPKNKKGLNYLTLMSVSTKTKLFGLKYATWMIPFKLQKMFNLSTI